MNSTEEKHNWRYCQIGGMTRVEILSGEDIAHLDELDQKKWTVLSCPVTGLNFDRATLDILDSDKDGHIKVQEVIANAKWLTSALLNPDLLIFGKSSVAIGDLNPESESGAKIIAAANKVFELTEKEDRSEISSSDVAAALAILDGKNVQDKPYGDDSDAAAAIVNKMTAKIDDWFARCSLAAFNTESSSKLDVNPERIASISDKNLADCMGEIATYPLCNISLNGLLPLEGQINPAWRADFATLKTLVFEKDFPGAESVSEEQWKEVKGKVATYLAGKNSILSDNAGTINELANFLKLTENFYHFLRNYITFSDFYSRNEKTPAMFQAGKLFIDQRCCDLCVEVTDMAAHNESAGLSGMYLIYCDCKSVALGKSKSIVAAITRGDVNNIRKGKNAIFYDCDGNLYNATVTKIIDNPISIKQAFLSPYIKFFNWITEKINKSAAEKESKSFDSLTKIEENAEKSIAQKDGDTKSNVKQAFDIAKFAGIFAAIGMAVGYISAAFLKLTGTILARWYNLPLLIIAIVVIISGPSMFIAWTKLRKRNLAPLLNANGWAINAAAIVSVVFGAGLTSEAKYPRLELVDPIAARKFKTDKKKRNITIAAIIIVAVFAALYFSNTLATIGLPW